MNDGLIHSKSTSSLANLSQFKRLQSSNEKFLALQLGDSRLAGYKRSFIRLIGSNLPLSNVERPRFEILPTGIKVVENHGRTTMFSLSDIRRLTDFPEVFTRSCLDAVAGKNNDPKEKVKSPGKSPTVATSTASDSQDDPKEKPLLTPGTVTPPPQEMASKINALEDELSTLRAQIAQLISTQKNESTMMTDTSLHLSRTDPVTSSTPIKIPQPPPPTPCGAPPPGIPPPPPPPPIHLMTSSKKPAMDLKEVIRQRRVAKGKAVSDPDNAPKKVIKPISMSDVLKDLHKVKLKSVERSPGGTPMGKLNGRKPAGKGPNRQEPVDSASFIQEALRKKFARVSYARRRSVSPDRSRDEKSDWTDSPPKFGQHLLRKRKPTTPIKKKKLPVDLPVKASASSPAAAGGDASSP